MVDANGLEPLTPCTSRNAHNNAQELPHVKIQMMQNGEYRQILHGIKWYFAAQRESVPMAK